MDCKCCWTITATTGLAWCGMLVSRRKKRSKRCSHIPYVGRAVEWTIKTFIEPSREINQTQCLTMIKKGNEHKGFSARLISSQPQVGLILNEFWTVISFGKAEMHEYVHIYKTGSRASGELAVVVSHDICIPTFQPVATTRLRIKIKDMNGADIFIWFRQIFVWIAFNGWLHI